MSVVKRKRGRPRLDESHEYVEFDLNLIQEFKKNPVLYDRTHPEHRTRDYTDRVWSRIGHNLNSSISHVKTRIIQLRNRYNVEKRRIEALQEQQNDPTLTSQWSLYKYLTFLNDYTKSRRPYSMPTTPHKIDRTVSEPEEEANDDSQTMLNGNMEDDLTNPHNFLTSTQVPNSSIPNMPIYPNMLAKSSSRLESSVAIGHKKYKDFGQFLASSLMEMNQLQALRLVNKFTNELVKTLKAEQVSNNGLNGQYLSSSGDGGGGDGSGGVGGVDDGVDDSDSSRMDSDS